MDSRREFLQKLTLGAGVIPFAFGYGTSYASQVASSVEDGPVLRVALMGLGSYANRVA